MKGTKLIRIGPKLLKKLELINQQRIKNNEKSSLAISGEILSDRIDIAGGLKEATKSNN